LVGVTQQRTAGLALLVDQTTRAPARAAVNAAANRPVPHRRRARRLHVGGVVLRGVGDLSEPPLTWNAARDKTIEQLDGRRQQHRLGERILDLNEAAGVLGPRGGETARTAQLDTRGHLMHTVGEQCRGERVAGMSGQLPVVERERQRGVPRDAATPAGAERCIHQIVGLCSSGGRRAGIGRSRCRGWR
jgi:hypothetical protein